VKKSRSKTATPTATFSIRHLPLFQAKDIGLRVPNAKVCRSSAFNDSTDSEPNFRHQFACELLAQDIGVNRLRRNFRTLSAIPRSYLLGKGKKGAYSAPLENL
jgi:hypothetical protein